MTNNKRKGGYNEAIRQAVENLPVGGRRLPTGHAGRIARMYGKTIPRVRKDVERGARLRNSGRAF
ncbi:hypothetical protein L1D34_14395 [Vibrio mediterranei]|uniref:hypothetical protein n=1 Tax=Vibrio mediterranei TaxID=689 RepID=UPI001EFE241C|nr:hypothetical protein [Vibrio mediterranei]MCG9626027.1 hypothetical protein [Vibrio mediterranei]